MIELVKAIKARWTAKSLDSSVTGGIHHSRAPERVAMPYCVFSEVSNTSNGETRCSRMGRFECQFDVFTASGDPEVCADLAETVRNTMVHGEEALASPLDPTNVDLANVRVGRDITTQGVGDEQVFRSTFSLVMDYTVSANRTPA